MSEVDSSWRTPRLSFFILTILWLLFLGWMVIATLTDLNSLAEGPPAVYGRLPSYATVQFALDAWALLAALIMGLVGFNPFRWLNGKRLIIGSMAFVTMLGRLVTGLTLYLLLSIPVQLPQWIFVIAAPFVLLSAGATVVGIIFGIIGLVFGFFVAVPIMLFNQIFAFDRALIEYRFYSRGLAGYIARAIYWLRNQPPPESNPDEADGARFATRKEAAALHNAAKGNLARMGFGHWTEEADTLFYIATDKHVLVMASTRSGKGVALIIPHLLRYQGSAFVLDPKGENAKATGRQRARLNGKVHYLDPFGITGKPQSRFNPLSRFTPETAEADAKALAAAMFVVEERNRDHWTAAGQQLLVALILYVYFAPDIQKANKDLPNVRRILLGTLDHALNQMILLDEADGLLRDLAISFKRVPEKEFGSIVSTAQRQTEILDNPFLIACITGDSTAPEVDFADWHRGTMTVYLCLAAPKFPTFNRWLRLVLSAALDTMTETLNPPELPVCFMLDELATLGRLQTVENAVGLSAGYGIQLVMVFQDVAQMRGLYEKRWASFVGNAGVRVLFNLDDFETAEYWSKFVGNRRIETYGRQEDIYGMSNGQSVNETMRPLLSTDRLMMDFASGKMLVLAQGTWPIVTDRVPYFKDKTLVGLHDDPRIPVRARTASPGAGSVPPTGPSAPNGGGPRPAPPPPPPPNERGSTSRAGATPFTNGRKATPDTDADRLAQMAERLKTGKSPPDPRKR